MKYRVSLGLVSAVPLSQREKHIKPSQTNGIPGAWLINGCIIGMQHLFKRDARVGIIKARGHGVLHNSLTTAICLTTEVI